MNQYRLLHLRTYSHIDSIDLFIKQFHVKYRTRKYWHSPIYHTYVPEIVTVYGIYLGVMGDKIDLLWKSLNPVDFWTFVGYFLFVWWTTHPLLVIIQVINWYVWVHNRVQQVVSMLLQAKIVEIVMVKLGQQHDKEGVGQVDREKQKLSFWCSWRGPKLHEDQTLYCVGICFS